MISASSLAEMFDRDLKVLEKEVTAFSSESSLWEIKGSVTNSAGNLTLHLCGNLQHFIGAVIGNSGYVRQREKEFSSKNIPRDQLIKLISETRTQVQRVLSDFVATDFEGDYPLEIMNRKWRTGEFIIHLYGHLQYHLGQINYLRRIIS
jgi:hypothetical protein